MSYTVYGIPLSPRLFSSDKKSIFSSEKYDRKQHRISMERFPGY